MASFAILGAAGFIGRHLSDHLARSGHIVYRLCRGDAVPICDHAIYCVGLTADFRDHPNATARAHVGLLSDLFDQHAFKSFLYLSSTRVYAGATDGRESTSLIVRPQAPDNLYNLTKLTGEALCLSQLRPTFRVARLSNVVGIGSVPPNFLASILHEATKTKNVTFRTSPDSSKDYIDIADVCSALEFIALSGRNRIYNVASGIPTTNSKIAALLVKHLGVTIKFAPNAPVVTFPQVSTDLLRAEFAFSPRSFSASFESLLKIEKEQDSTR